MDLITYVLRLAKITWISSTLFGKFFTMILSIPLPKHADAVTVPKLFNDYIYRHHGLPENYISDKDVFL